MVNLIIIILSIIGSLVSFFLIPSISYFWVPLVIFVIAYIVFTIIYILILLLFGAFVNTKKEYNEQSGLYNFAVIRTMEWILNIFNTKIKTSGLEKVPHDEKYLLVYNHTSNFDPIVESWILRKDNLIHISKPENFKKIIAGPAIRRNCYIEINRENSFEAAKSIHRAVNFIKNQKYCVGIAPEGTRNKGDEKVLMPFRDGCFKIALYAKCPIVVVEVYNTKKISSDGPFKRTNVEMNVLDVLRYDDFKDLKTHEISDIVKTKIQNAIDERK